MPLWSPGRSRTVKGARVLWKGAPWAAQRVRGTCPGERAFGSGIDDQIACYVWYDRAITYGGGLPGWHAICKNHYGNRRNGAPVNG